MKLKNIIPAFVLIASCAHSNIESPAGLNGKKIVTGSDGEVSRSAINKKHQVSIPDRHKERHDPYAIRVEYDDDAKIFKKRSGHWISKDPEMDFTISKGMVHFGPNNKWDDVRGKSLRLSRGTYVIFTEPANYEFYLIDKFTDIVDSHHLDVRREDAKTVENIHLTKVDR